MSRKKSPTKSTIPGRPVNRFRETPFEPPSEAARDSLMYIQRLVQPDDLSVVFQPIVHMNNLELFAYEALVRCRVADLANPQKLFERAVADGCVGRLGRMVREVALPLCEGMPVFLNVHPAELEERWVVRPDDPMYFHDRAVYVEITESVPLSHFALCRDVLNEVRSRGHLYLVVDDLGAGYSNLKRIADLEPRIVKLDRDLIAGVESGSRQQRLVSQIVSLCESLGADVVAEGIETATEYEALRETGVHYGQGFLFARPSYPHPPITPPPGFKSLPSSRAPARNTSATSVYPSGPPARLTPATPSVAPVRAASSIAPARAVPSIAPARAVPSIAPARGAGSVIPPGRR